jgi:hypothetical protein
VFVTCSPAEAESVLCGLKHLALIHPQHRLVPLDRMVLEAAAQLAFDPPLRDVDLDALDPIGPEQLAARVADPDVRETAAALCAILALTEGELDDARLREAVRFNHALGQREAYVHDLLELARGHQQWVQADMIRRNLDTFPGMAADMKVHGAFPYTGTPEDQALAARYVALGDCAPGTFGRAYFDHFREHGFGFPGEVGALTEYFAAPHDSIHVLSGYGTSTQGELLVSAFTAGMHRPDAMAAHILPTLLEWQVGLDLSFAVAPEQGWLDPRKYLVAIDRGRGCTRDVLDGSWDLFAHADRDLDELRTAFGITPLDAGDAGIGIEPHGR